VPDILSYLLILSELDDRLPFLLVPRCDPMGPRPLGNIHDVQSNHVKVKIAVEREVLEILELHGKAKLKFYFSRVKDSASNGVSVRVSISYDDSEGLRRGGPYDSCFYTQHCV